MGILAISPLLLTIPEAPVGNPDPRFFAVRDSVPGLFLVRFVAGAYTPPTQTTYDPATGKFGPAPVPKVGSPPSPEALAAALARRYEVTTVNVAEYLGVWMIRASERQAGTISHDPLVDNVETDANVYAGGVAPPKVAPSTVPLRALLGRWHGTWRPTDPDRTGRLTMTIARVPGNPTRIEITGTAWDPLYGMGTFRGQLKKDGMFSFLFRYPSKDPMDDADYYGTARLDGRGHLRGPFYRDQGDIQTPTALDLAAVKAKP